MSVPTEEDSFVFVNMDSNAEENNTIYNITDTTMEPRPTEMKSMHVVSNVRNRYARTVVTSKYANPDMNAQQATFSIVLPDTAFIAGFVMEIKGKKYEAYVKEKEEAKLDFEQAIARNLAAAHVAVSARDSNKFTVSVNVEPQSDVIFILTYEELLVRKHSKYEMVVNLHPGQILDDLGVDIHINETRPVIHVETPAMRSGNEISNTVTKNNYASIKRVTGEIVHVSFHPTVEQQKEMTNAFSNGISGQFVVEYEVERDPLGGEVLVNDGYFVHFFAPTGLKPIQKHVVFVLDVSASMQGRKVEQLKEAMTVILSELNPEDYFNIVKFDTDAKILYSNNYLQEVGNTSLPATAKNIKKAQKAVDSMQAVGGGTNISDALITALSLTLKGIVIPEKNVKVQPIIVFLTDGQANCGESNPDRIIDIVLKRNDSENKSAIFTLAFGNDANKEFLKELAVKNSGFLRNIYEAADASLQLQDFYKQISSPLLTNINFKYSEKVNEVTKHNFDILFNGSEFVVTGKIDKVVDGFVVVEGSTLYGIDDFRPTIIPICPTKEEKETFGDLERLWAYMTIKQLLDKKYEKKNQNEDTTSSETLEKQALKLALKYAFVTPVTSLVVVKPEETDNADLQWGSVYVASSDCLLPQRRYRLIGGGPPDNQMSQQQGYCPSMGGGQAMFQSCMQMQQCMSPMKSVDTMLQRRCSDRSFKSMYPSDMHMDMHYGVPPTRFFDQRLQQLHSCSVMPLIDFGNCQEKDRDRSTLRKRRGRPAKAQSTGKREKRPLTAELNSNLQSSSIVAEQSETTHFGTCPNLFNSLDSPLLCASLGAQSSCRSSSSNTSQPPELKSLHVDSNVRNRYARTVVTSKYANPDTSALQAMFCIVLPDTAFIAAFVMKIKGTKYKANMREKMQATKEYQQAITQGLAAAHVTASSDNSNKFTVSVNIEPQSEVTFILTYEQLLVQKNSKYEIVTNLHPRHVLEDLEIDVKISDTTPITNVKTPVLRSKNLMMKTQHANINQNKDGSIHISFTPTVEQQKEIINILQESDEHNGVLGQFVVIIETNSKDTQVSVKDVPVAAPVTDLVVIKSE